MFRDSIIAKTSTIFKFLFALKFTLYLTTPQLHHLTLIMSTMIMKGFNGKITDSYELLPSRHRTSIGRFLSDSPWNEDYIERALQKHVLKTVWDLSRDTGKPIYVILDDTISEKTVPSSKALNPIQKCSFHNSHLKNKTVYGHQLVTVMLSCNNVVLPYSIKIYDKKVMSKIDMAADLIKTLPSPVNSGYVMCDSWYSCKKIFSATKKAGYDYIGGLKTNRVIYPKGHERLGIKLHAFGKTLTESDVDLVKVGNREFYVYSYIGKLNDLVKAHIVLSWPKEALFKDGCLRAFISPNAKITLEDLLNHYAKRWPIETFFRESKKKLGLDDYQVRSHRSIQRYFLILMLTYVYCGLEASGETLKFSNGIKVARKQIELEKITLIVEQSRSGKSIEDIVNLFVAA